MSCSSSSRGQCSSTTLNSKLSDYADFCEKTGIQALDRTQPILPMRPGQVERRTYDYKRNGIVDLFAVLNLATGEVIHHGRARHRATEFLAFLKAIDAAVPDDLAVHVVLNNSSTHKTPAIKKWLLRHPRFVFHFTPTSSSWLNLVERWFAELTNRMLRRSAHQSTKELTTALNGWVAIDHRIGPLRRREPCR